MIGDDDAGRYALIGSQGEMLDVVLMRLMLCTDCGAIVGDTEMHDRWHESGRP